MPIVNWERKTIQFQSTLPVRGATRAIETLAASAKYFNPRSPRGERRYAYGCSNFIPYTISIHAPREGSDVLLLFGISFDLNFNPRSPRGERPS